MSAIRYGILHDATDEAPLWELTWRSAVHVGRRTTEVHPARVVQEVRPALVALLQEGHLALYELGSSPDRALDISAALAIVADDENWGVPAETGRTTAYAVALTASGDEEFWRLAAVHRPTY